MKIWKVTEVGDGGAPLLIDRMALWDEIGGGLETEEEGNKYQIEVVEIDSEKFYNLPEWGGF